jgi:hypothetical protein
LPSFLEGFLGNVTKMVIITFFSEAMLAVVLVASKDSGNSIGTKFKRRTIGLAI